MNEHFFLSSALRVISIRYLMLIFLMVMVAVSASCTVFDTTKERIVNGDHVAFEYTCKLPNGEILMTTDMTVADEANEFERAVFMPRKNYGAVVIVAGQELDKTERIRSSPLEVAVEEFLAAEVIGREKGATHTVRIAATQLPRLPESDNVLSMARVRTRLKQRNFTVKDYERLWKKPPEIGDEVVLDSYLPGRIIAIENDEVIVNFDAKEGDVVVTDLGPATIHVLEDSYRIDINAQTGHLTRNGPYVGRVVRVTENMVMIDYGHPSGGEPLTCEVTVE
ncbi:MAG: hypothetical protein U9O82_11085 [Thermodesulfobacteriota bacterium]|nr:hypothetical protein [Thermodesulfobacteriota bacterium]